MKLPESVSGPLYLAIRCFLCIYTLMVDGARDDDPTQVRVAWHCTCFNIRRASRAVTQFYDQIMAPSGIKATQFTMLGAVAMMGSPSVTALSQQLNLDRTTLTRNLKVLVKMGLITISRGEDRRERVVTPTEFGLTTIKEATPAWQEAQTSLAKSLGEERWRRMLEDLSDLDILIENLEKKHT